MIEKESFKSNCIFLSLHDRKPPGDTFDRTLQITPVGIYLSFPVCPYGRNKKTGYLGSVFELIIVLLCTVYMHVYEFIRAISCMIY